MVLPNGYKTKFNIGDKITDSYNVVKVVEVSLSEPDEFRSEASEGIDVKYAYSILAIYVPKAPDATNEVIRIPVMVIDKDDEVKLYITDLLNKL